MEESDTQELALARYNPQQRPQPQQQSQQPQQRAKPEKPSINCLNCPIVLNVVTVLNAYDVRIAALANLRPDL